MNKILLPKSIILGGGALKEIIKLIKIFGKKNLLL